MIAIVNEYSVHVSGVDDRLGRRAPCADATHCENVPFENAKLLMTPHHLSTSVEGSTPRLGARRARRHWRRHRAGSGCGVLGLFCRRTFQPARVARDEVIQDILGIAVAQLVVDTE
jgi:hypothetical protein